MTKLNKSKTNGNTNIIRKTMIFILLLAGLLIITEIVLLAKLQWQRSSYKKYWDQVAAAPASENAIWYVALGDSSAQGIGASHPTKGYVGLLAERIGQKSNRPVYVVNLSVTGARLKDIADYQIPKLKELELPSDTIVTLGIGSNNIRDFSAQQFREEFEIIINSLPKQTVISDVPYFGGGRANAKEANAKSASQIIGEMVNNRGMELVRLHAATEQHDSWRNYAADFFHPNDRAYRIWADAFWGTIENQL